LVGGFAALTPSFGCGSKGGTGFGDGGTGQDSDVPPDLDGDIFDPDTGPTTEALTVTPPNPVLTANGTPVTQQFTALSQYTMQPVTPDAWSLDNVALGGIDQNGLFTANGTVGGVATIEAMLGQALGTTTVTVQVVLSENPGGVSAGDQAKLKAGGNADGTFRWLYPYDKTVFPRGLTPPLFQLDGATAPTSFMLHIKTKNLDYTGFYAGSNPARVSMSTAMWKSVTLSSTGIADPLVVEMTKLAGGVVTGPVKETWSIAQGSLRGSCYYNSYSNGGETLRLKLGTMSQQLIGGCNVCHSVSANGNVVAANHGHSYGATNDLTKNGAPIIQQGDPYVYSFPALYPDGSLLVTTYGSGIPGMGQTNPPRLFDVKTNTQLTAPGLDNSGVMAQMPAFSADGKKLTFNRKESGGHVISVMDFDQKTKTFSKLTDVWTDPQWPGWPQFTPDSLKILFHSGSGQDYATWSGNQANIWMIDVATKKAVACNALNGLMANSTPYLPYTTQETNFNFEPTILPLAVGGYYWTIITSRRFYGNTVTPQNGSADQRKKLWVAAIDINPKPGVDPSHPAFYLEGQDANVGSLRGFWALDPCKANGQTCESGDECCGGFCRQVGNTKQCVPPPMGCSNEFEKCTVAADCCNSSMLCIAGHCAQPAPQ
jgi:hypothetical protein